MPARRSELPRELRRQADRAAVRGRQPPDELISAANRGLLTRTNTEAGTKGRQAADAVVYARRASKAAPGESVRARLGHEPSGPGRSMSTLLDDPRRYVVLEDLTRGEARRTGRYAEAVRQYLRHGNYRGQLMDRDRFRRVIGSWKPIRGERFLADPDAVLALFEALRAEDREVFTYGRGRP